MKTMLISFVITMIVGGVLFGGYLVIFSGDSDSKAADSSSDESDSSADSISDGELKTQVSRLLAAANDYAANNNGTFKIDGQALVTDGYIEFDEGEEFEIVQEAPGAGQLEYRVGQVCSVSNELESSSSLRVVAVRVQLSDGTYYCADNQ